MNAATNQRPLEEYLDLEYPFVVIADPDDGGYVIEFPDLPGCMTQAETLAEIPEMAEDARTGWIETAFEDGMEIPLPTYPESHSGKFNVRLPKSLHHRLVESAERDGVSLNQHVVSLLSEAVTLCAVERRLAKLESALTGEDAEDIDTDDPVDARAAFVANPRSVFSEPT